MVPHFPVMVVLGCGLVFAGGDFHFQLGRVLAPVQRTELDGAEIAAYVPSRDEFLVTTGDKGVSALPVTAGAKASVTSYNGEVASVAAHGDLVAVPEMGVPHTLPGSVHLYQFRAGDARFPSLVKTYPTCAHPDMITFTPDGSKILVACEGEIDAETRADPEGAIGVIDLSRGVASGVSVSLGFGGFDSLALAKRGVRLAGPGNFKQNIEPEYIAVAPDGRTAWATLQENDAVARIDLVRKKITDIFPLGAVDHSKPGNEFDYRQDGRISLENAPLRGLRQPDGIAALTVNGRDYFFTANEGSPREYSFYTDVTTAAALSQAGKLDAKIFTPELVRSMGALPVSSMEPCAEGAPPCRSLNVFGGRSMSVFDGATGKLVFDSGSMLERMLAKDVPSRFNQNDKKEKHKMDARSDDKGSEPETVTLGKVNGHTLAFLGLERAGGIVVWDVTRPESPEIIDYIIDDRDRGPEGILFVPAEKNASHRPLLAVGYEYSRTFVVYTVSLP